MSKVSGSYDSVVLGVSEQKAHDRRPGQHEEQVNLLSDAVRGLARRPGSVWSDEIALGAGSLSAVGAEATAMREFTFVIDGVEYTLLYRTAPSANGKDKFMYLLNKATGKFMPVVYENSTWVDTLVSGGVSACASAGRYVYLAGNDNVPTYTAVNVWSDPANLQRCVAWVRAGAYSRKFKLTLTKTDGTKVEVSYKTKPSAYPELNDTSDISFYKADGSTPDPEYQKKLNDRVNLYNSNATAWIVEAAEDITGENIAQKLVDELLLLGIAASRIESTVVVDDPDFKEISADDGGDNTLLRAVGMEVSAPTLMSTIHYVGKVVRIRPQGASDKESYYLRAYAKDGEATGWTEVVWREAAGVVQTPVGIFSQAVIHDGTMYVAQNGVGLTALAPGSGEHVPFEASVVGDGASSPAPAFFGKRITMLSVFQDRLLIGSGGVVNASRTNDYLHFYRQTVLNLQDNDPVEMFAYGSEGDTLRHAVMFDKDLILFGDLKQYAITGRQVLTPKSPLITTMSAYKDASAAVPVASGNYVFYGKSNEGRTSMHQMRVGDLRESPESVEVSQQLDKYLRGQPVQLAALTAPNVVLLRTGGAINDVYTYAYIDTSDRQRFDSWSRWHFNPVLGRLIGVSEYKGDVYLIYMREAGGSLYVVADKVSLDAKLSDKPYADSLRRHGSLTGWHAATAQDQLIAAADNTTPYFLLGAPLDKLAPFVEQLPSVESSLWVGAVSPAYVTPTNPYMRDQQGKAILSGRLTLNTVLPTVSDTGGMTAEVHTVNGSVVTLNFEGRLTSRASNVIGGQPLASEQLHVSVGKEVRECKYTLSSSNWLPMSITSIEWIGQHFNRVRRAG